MKKTICVLMGGHFSAKIGGAQFQAKCVVDALKASGKFNIYYLARVVNPDYNPVGYKIVQIAKPGGLREYSFALDSFRLFNLLSELRPDVIYQRGLKAYTGVMTYYARKRNCHSVFHVASDHSLHPASLSGYRPARWLQYLDKRMGEYGVRHADSIIAQTNYQSDLLAQRYGRPATAVIRNFHPLPDEDITKASGNLKVIWVGNFKAVKRPEVFVRLARDLSFRKDLHFVMIGRPGQSSEYLELHQEMLNISNLTYLGEVPIEEVNRQLAGGDLFVNTSLTEGFPNTFIQAWMRAVPTLSLGVNPDDLLSSGEIGYCGNSYNNLLDKILQLADDPELRVRMGGAARTYALHTHSPEAAGRLIEILSVSPEKFSNIEPGDVKR